MNWVHESIIVDLFHKDSKIHRPNPHFFHFTIFYLDYDAKDRLEHSAKVRKIRKTTKKSMKNDLFLGKFIFLNLAK